MTAAAQGKTIDDLARQFELPVSTLRMYQHRGLLPAPERRGRVAYYGPDHEARLRMLTTLQDRGFSLASIKELLDGWEEGRSLDEVLGLRAAGSVWESEPGEVLDLPDLVARFGPDAATPELVTRAVELGLTRLTGDGRVEITSPRYLDVGTRLVELGIPASEVLDEYEVLRRHSDELAARFTDLFRRHIWTALLDSSAAPAPAAERLDDVRRSLEELGPLAVAIVEATLRHALQDAAQAFLDEQAGALAGEPDLPRARRSRARR